MRSAKYNLEPLENRVLFSSYVVLTAGDDSGSLAPVLKNGIYQAATLRDAVYAADAAGGNNNITLGFSPSETITLASIPIAVKNSAGTTTIEGAGVTISGTGTKAIFQIEEGASFEFQNLIIKDSTPTTSGIANDGTLILSSATLNTPVANEGKLQVQGGTSYINGALTTTSGSALNLTATAPLGGALLTVANGFTNTGAINLANNVTTGSSADYAVLKVTTGTLTNAAGATITTTAAQGLIPGVNDQLTANINNAGTFTIDGVTTLNNLGLTFTNSGVVSVASGQTFTVNYGNFNEDGGLLSGSGTINFQQDYAGRLQFNVEKPFSDGGATLLLGFASINGPSAFTNVAGTKLILSSTTVNAPLINKGTLLVQGGTSYINGTLTTTNGSAIDLTATAPLGGALLTVANGFTNIGAINLANNVTTGSSADYAVLKVTTGTLTNAAGATITTTAAQGLIPGVNDQLTANINNAGTFTVDGVTTLNNLGLTFTNSGVVSVASGQTFTVNYGNFNEDGGLLSGSGTINFQQDYAGRLQFNVEKPFSGGGATLLLGFASINGPATFTNIAGAKLILSNTTVNAPLINKGTLLVQGGTSYINGTLTTTNGSAIDLTATAPLGGALLTVANGFTNIGAINLANNVTTGSSADYAVLKVTTGTLTNAVGGTITTTTAPGIIPGVNDQLTATIDNAGTFTVEGATTLNDTGKTFVNTGTLAISDTKGLTIDGNFSQSSAGTLHVGIAASTIIDALTIDGSATFAGSLAVLLSSGFAPTAGESFKVITYHSFTGKLNLVSLKGFSLTSVFSTTSLAITAHTA